MSRPKKRKVTIRLGARNAKDPRKLFEAVESEFRPAELTIEVADPEEALTIDEKLPGIPDEQLEAHVSHRIGDLLDEKAKTEAESDSKEATKPKPSRNATIPPPSKRAARRWREKVEKSRKRTAEWFKIVKTAGIGLLIKVLYDHFVGSTHD